MGTIVLHNAQFREKPSGGKLGYSRKQPYTKTTDQAPDNHHFEPRGKGFNGTAESKDDRAPEERHLTSEDISYTASRERCD